MGELAVLLDAGLRFEREPPRVSGRVTIVVHVILDRGKPLQDDHGKHVVGDVVLIARRIVRRPEAGPDHARVAHPAALAGIREIGMAVTRAAVVVLLGAQGCKHPRERSPDFRGKDRLVVRLLPILIREPNGIE